MDKRVLGAVLLCFSVLFAHLPVVAAGASDWEACELRDFATDASLSLEELLALPEYVTAGEEPEAIPIPPDGDIPPTPPPKPAPVNTMVIVDDDAAVFLGLVNLGTGVSASLYEWAVTLLEVGDDPFWSSFSIDFVAVEFHYWESPNFPQGQPITDMQSLLAHAIVAFPKPAGVDVIYVLTGQNTVPILGISYAYYNIFIVSVWAAVYLVPLQNVWQHEASHLYYAKDHAVTDFLTSCIMNSWYTAYTRVWCSGCTSRIAGNKFRYG